MPTHPVHRRLALARAKFDPVARVLAGLSNDIEKEWGRPAALKPAGGMQQTAGNAYSLRYSLWQPEEGRLSLTFIVIGEESDLLLIRHEGSDAPDMRADPGRVEQRVYRLHEVEEIKAVVKRKIIDHLRARGVLH